MYDKIFVEKCYKLSEMVEKSIKYDKKQHYSTKFG